MSNIISYNPRSKLKTRAEGQVLNNLGGLCQNSGTPPSYDPDGSVNTDFITNSIGSEVDLSPVGCDSSVNSLTQAGVIVKGGEAGPHFITILSDNYMRVDNVDAPGICYAQNDIAASASLETVYNSIFVPEPNQNWDEVGIIAYEITFSSNVDDIHATDPTGGKMEMRALIGDPDEGVDRAEMVATWQNVIDGFWRWSVSGYFNNSVQQTLEVSYFGNLNVWNNLGGIPSAYRPAGSNIVSISFNHYVFYLEDGQPVTMEAYINTNNKAENTDFVNEKGQLKLEMPNESLSTTSCRCAVTVRVLGKVNAQIVQSNPRNGGFPGDIRRIS